MGPFEYIALFGALAYWPIYMALHRRWSFKAKALSGIFFGTLAAVVGLGGSLILLLNHGRSIHTLWPLQFVFPVITILSLLVSFIVTVVFDDKGNV